MDPKIKLMFLDKYATEGATCLGLTQRILLLLEAIRTLSIPTIVMI